MKDLKDTLTVDPADPVRRQRGRPPTGEALTPAQRQAARRARLKASGKETLAVEIDSDVLARLREFVEFKDLTLGEVVSKILRDRLLRKR